MMWQVMGNLKKRNLKSVLQSRVFKLKLRDPVDGGTWSETTVWSYSAWGNWEGNRWGWPDGSYLVISDPVKEGASWFVNVNIDADAGQRLCFAFIIQGKAMPAEAAVH